MKTSAWNRIHQYLGGFGLLVFLSAAWASDESQLNLIQSNERLSSWLIRNQTQQSNFPPLIQWQVPSERIQQEKLRDAVIDQLEALEGSSTEKRTLEALVSWLYGLKLTGRVYLASTDAYWLLGTPRQDPVLQKGQAILVSPRPNTVTILKEDARPCTVPHQSGSTIQDYLRRCWGDAFASRVDIAWLAQGDGLTKQFGIAAWNAEPQDEPGNGAWIWAPSRDANLPPEVSDNIARLLANLTPASNKGDSQETLAATAIGADSQSFRARQLTSSDWGEVGLLQTPTARMSPAGGIRIHTSNVSPYTRGTVIFQPFDWLEAGFRYTDVANRLYGPSIAGNQSYKDKSIDFKVRLMEESAFAPQLALGVRDLGGTGLFSAEYLVASKRWGNWDASLGLGWGYLGTRGNVKNPLSWLSNGFDTRPGNTTATGGTANFQSMFKGPSALFGGIQWHSPAEDLLLKVELDGNDYQSEPQGNTQTVKSAFNLGLVYRYSPNVDVTLGVERGNRVMVGFTVQGELPKLNAPKQLDPVLPPVRPANSSPGRARGLDATAADIALHTGWTVTEIAVSDRTVTVVAEVNAALYLQERIDRAVTILHQDSNADISRFAIQLRERGLALAQVEIGRPEWLADRVQAEAPTLRAAAQQVLPGSASEPSEELTTKASPSVWRAGPKGFSTEWGPSYSQILGGPDGFLLYQLGVQARLEHRWTDQTWLSGTVNARLLDNYARFVYDAPSNLPRVRTNQREYTTTSRVTMPLFQMTHVRELGNNHFVSGYAGMLESMYGGVGGEWLYRPWQGRTALGVDLNHVRQRDFNQGLGFRDYRVSTGHATLYWYTGWHDIQVSFSAGRYLAGDYGATLDVKRSFPNGMSLGAWATKTSVSSAEFGEGSFDKGIYLNIPFDVMMPKSSAGNGTLVWNPLTRDGGARLSRRFPLFDITRQRDARAFAWRTGGPQITNTGDDLSYVLTADDGGPLGSLTSTGKALGMQIADIPASTWLWAGAGLLASSALDRPLDQWAANHQGPTWRKIGKAGSAVPIVLAAGTGLLYTGLGGEDASGTAKTALSAGLFTMGINLATRFAVGRQRPTEGEGPYAFQGFTTNSLSSAFASNHTALAFALATPFAQQYNMPWLYAVAGASAIGRVQQREHWVSDTVAGAFVGYAVASLVSEQRFDRRRLKVSLAPQSVFAEWSFH